MSWLELVGTTVRLKIWLQPRAARDEIVGIHDGCLKVKVCAPPVHNRANQNLRSFVARQLGVSPSRITILSGTSSRRKVLEVADLEESYVRSKLL